MSKKRKHINVPVFIPHLGCPNDCVFCNQRSISGKMKFEPDSVIDEIEQTLSTVAYNTEVEIAFFGGSFTGIDRQLMIRLLNIAQGYVDAGRVTSIRLSTRPDYIDDEIIGILKSYSVKTVELGIQSTSDKVLSECKRGHTSDASAIACKKLKDAGFSLIGQMMIGLPRSTPKTEMDTARIICSLCADGARVYPTVVFAQTELAKMSESGEYIPLSLEDAVERTKNVLDIFVNCKG